MPKRNKKKFYEGKEEKLKFIAGHALIMGHLPDKLDLVKVANKLSTNQGQDIESLGLFDSSSPNYTTYYPEVTSEDLNPKDSEFVEPVFRMLSNTVVQHRYNPIEFPADILKASMKKLIGQTIHIDHEMALGNAIGSIKAVEWQEAYKVGSFEIPAGINAILKIDGKANPRIARGIMMEPPSIHSNSVTVAFTWKPSHEGMDESEFYNKLGGFDKDGKLIRKIATDIKFYAETSLVGLGADPFAQRVKDGKIIKPDLAKSRNPISKKSLSGNEGVGDWFASMDWKSGNFELSQNSLENQDNNYNNKNDLKMEELLRFLETLFGFDAESLTEENYEEQLNTIGVKLTSLQSKVDTPEEPTIEGFEGTAAITTALQELGTLKSAIPKDLTMAKLVEFSTIGTDSINELRAETLRLYKVTLKDKEEDENIISLINTADYRGLTALHKQYDDITEGEYNFVCTDCDSTNVTRAKAKVEDGDEIPPEIKSNAEVIKDVISRNQSTFTIYKEAK